MKTGGMVTPALFVSGGGKSRFLIEFSETGGLLGRSRRKFGQAKRGSLSGYVPSVRYFFPSTRQATWDVLYPHTEDMALAER